MQFEPKRIDEIAEALRLEGLIVLTDFLPNDLANQLMQQAQELAVTDFKPAAIGRHSEQNVNTAVRTDSTLWLSHDSGPQSDYLDCIEQLRVSLNSRLFMGLFDFEGHYAHYAKGHFYRRHLDAFRGRSNRVLSTVLYLNPNWNENDGGELLLYADEQTSPLRIVSPNFNSCVIFLSDTFPHEVLTSQRDRYSIAGWYRLNGHSSHHIDPAN